jgi:hypothetical protein
VCVGGGVDVNSIAAVDQAGSWAPRCIGKAVQSLPGVWVWGDDTGSTAAPCSTHADTGH